MRNFILCIVLTLCIIAFILCSVFLAVAPNGVALLGFSLSAASVLLLWAEISENM